MLEKVQEALDAIEEAQQIGESLKAWNERYEAAGAPGLNLSARMGDRYVAFDGIDLVGPIRQQSELQIDACLERLAVLFMSPALNEDLKKEPTTAAVPG